MSLSKLYKSYARIVLSKEGDPQGLEVRTYDALENNVGLMVRYH